MKNYERPVVILNDELAEGIFATGGSGVNYDDDATCWDLRVEESQRVTHEGYAHFRVIANHHTNLKHISEQTTVTVVFSAPIKTAIYEGFDVSVSGNVVTATRKQLGDAYGSGDNFNSLLTVYTSDPADAASVVPVSSMITCKHATNVQGDFD